MADYIRKMLKSIVVKPVLQIGDTRLGQVSNDIPTGEVVSRATQVLIENLLDTCNSEKEGTAGLSAVQIGELKRVFVARDMNLDEDSDENPSWVVVINPELEIVDSSEHIAWEGCLSIGQGGARLFAPVARANGVRMKYLDESGQRIVMEASGYMSHILQHEIDHLNGVLFLKHVRNPENIWRSEDLDKYIEEHGGYPPIR